MLPRGGGYDAQAAEGEGMSERLFELVQSNKLLLPSVILAIAMLVAAYWLSQDPVYNAFYETCMAEKDFAQKYRNLGPQDEYCKRSAAVLSTRSN